MANGFFWYVAPMIFSGALALVMAAAVIGGEDSPTVALPDRTMDSAVVDVPPASRLTPVNPAAR